MRILAIPAEEFKEVGETAHLACFGEFRPRAMERFQFALLSTSDDGREHLGYVTCKEADAETLYWQYGGAFPGTAGTTKAFRLFKEFLRWGKGRYNYISFLVENKNTPMLKMAMKMGFLITGVRVFKEWILLEHSVDLRGMQI